MGISLPFFPYKQEPSQARGPFLERAGNLTDTKSYFEIKVSRKVGYIVTSDEGHFVFVADDFTVQFLKLLKFPA